MGGEWSVEEIFRGVSAWADASPGMEHNGMSAGVPFTGKDADG